MESGVSYGNALRKLVSTIKKYDPSFDTSQVETIAMQCCSLVKGTGNWNYEMKDFSFPRKTFKEAKLDKVHPIKAKNFKVILSVKANGRYVKLSKVADDPLDDPIFNLSVNVVVSDLSGPLPESVFCAWHLDSHPPEGVDEETPSLFVHPRYHWQFGGKKVWEAQELKDDKEVFYGSHLLLESPRLPHPPLDIMLAIDFVLANYYSETWNAVRNDDEYKRQIKDAQYRYWRCYFAAINSNWSLTKAKERSDFMPFLI